MRGRALMLAVTSGLLLTLVWSGSAIAHVTKFETTLTIKKAPSGAVDPGDEVLVFGKVKPAKCQDGQKISLFKVTPGSDNKIGTDKIDADGEYSFSLHPRSDMHVYAKVPKKVVVSSYQHSHTCKADKSDTIAINVS